MYGTDLYPRSILTNHEPTALEASESETKQHLDKIEELEQSLFELSGEIGAGRHVPPGVRVLSLKDNPEQQWVDLRQAVMDRLKGENEALMKRLRELEESGARAGGMEGEGEGESKGELVPRESWELVNKEKTELEEVVRQKEKRLLRLQQVRKILRRR
jgi:mitotic spindle assembly checkpoint protein MAD1